MYSIFLLIVAFLIQASTAFAESSTSASRAAVADERPKPAPVKPETISSPISPERLSRFNAFVASTKSADDPKHPKSRARSNPEKLTSPIPGTKVAWLQTIWDSAECPEMVAIGPGSFLMGKISGTETPKDGDGVTTRRVTITKPFAMGKYSITFDEWDVCMAAGYCLKSPRDDWGRGNKPVTGVNWNDVQQYAKWLSEKTGKLYRLPTEAEWEYAARAGTVTARYWGDEIGINNTSCLGCGSRWDDKEPAPVGSFKPNPWGLHDMLGNTHQWTADCWHPDYNGAPNDGSAWQEPKCGKYVIRGGSWMTDQRASRADYRVGMTTGFSQLGFRLARDL